MSQLESSLFQIEEYLRRIAEALEASVKAIQTSPQQENVFEHDSTGSCPSCQSLSVLQEGQYPKAIYKCKDCGAVWVNDSSKFFDS